jgi:hypothetical protein
MTYRNVLQLLWNRATLNTTNAIPEHKLNDTYVFIHICIFHSLWRWRQRGPPKLGILPQHYMASRPSDLWTSETLMSYHINTRRQKWRWGQQCSPKRWYPTTLHGVTTQWRWRQQGSPKRWYLTATLHGVTTHKTWTWIFIAVRTWNPAFGLQVTEEPHGFLRWCQNCQASEDKNITCVSKYISNRLSTDIWCRNLPHYGLFKKEKVTGFYCYGSSLSVFKCKDVRWIEVSQYWARGRLWYCLWWVFVFLYQWKWNFVSNASKMWLACFKFMTSDL